MVLLAESLSHIQLCSSCPSLFLFYVFLINYGIGGGVGTLNGEHIVPLEEQPQITADLGTMHILWVAFVLFCFLIVVVAGT